MKKSLLLASAALIFGANVANAAYIEATPYIGLDYSTFEATYGKGLNKLVEDDFTAYSFSGGIRFEKYFGLEAYIQRTNKESYKHSTSKWTTNSWSIGADALAFIPVYDDLDIIGGIGFGEYVVRAREAGHKRHKDTGYGIRYTLGAQYNLSYNWGIRATYRYVDYSNSVMNHSDEMSLGVRYSF